MGQDLFPNLPHIAVGKHRVDQVLFMGAVKAHAFKDRAAVMGQLQDVSGNGCRILGDDHVVKILDIIVIAVAGISLENV